jgi:hypothetical protein
MKIICTLGLLMRWLAVAFLLGLAAGAYMLMSIPASPASPPAHVTVTMTTEPDRR